MNIYPYQVIRNTDKMIALFRDMTTKIIAVCFCMLLLAGFANAMTSINYTINWDSMNSGGDDMSTSTNYQIRDTLGDQAVGSSTSENYILRAGYRQGDTETASITFDIGTQENSTQTNFGSFSNAGKTVTVSSTASYSIGNFIGVVEDQGLGQVIAIGKIDSILGNVITVDKWDGDPTSISASPNGVDDYVYRIDGDAAELGTLTAGEGKTSLTHTRIITNAKDGFTIYVNTDGDLRVSTSTVIINVSDGAVTAGSEEYGGRVFGATATSTGSDFAFATSTREIQTSTTYANDDRIGLIYKASITGSTGSGNYTQKIFYTVTANL